MKEGRRRSWGWGCLWGAAGLAIGASLAVLAFVLWAVSRPADLPVLRNPALPQGLDLEVRLSETFLNQVVEDELAQRDLAGLTRIVLDAQPGEVLVATLQGTFDLGGLLPSTPALTTEVWLGVEKGSLVAYIAEVQVGPVGLQRGALPDFLQDVFGSAEDAIVREINERVAAQGFEVTGFRTDEESITLGLRTSEGQDSQD